MKAIDVAKEQYRSGAEFPATKTWMVFQLSASPFQPMKGLKHSIHCWNNPYGPSKVFVALQMIRSANTRKFVLQGCNNKRKILKSAQDSWELFLCLQDDLCYLIRGTDVAPCITKIFLLTKHLLSCGGSVGKDIVLLNPKGDRSAIKDIHSACQSEHPLLDQFLPSHQFEST